MAAQLPSVLCWNPCLAPCCCVVPRVFSFTSTQSSPPPVVTAACRHPGGGTSHSRWAAARAWLLLGAVIQQQHQQQASLSARQQGPQPACASSSSKACGTAAGLAEGPCSEPLPPSVYHTGSPLTAAMASSAWCAIDGTDISGCQCGGHSAAGVSMAVCCHQQLQRCFRSTQHLGIRAAPAAEAAACRPLVPSCTGRIGCLNAEPVCPPPPSCVCLCPRLVC
jgi:hypothetical protein